MLSQENQTEQQEWIVVTKNKNKHKGSVQNKIIHNKGNVNLFQSQYAEQYVEKFINSQAFDINSQEMEKIVQKIQGACNLSQFYVQCLGLGNFLSSKKAFIQLQFLQKIILPTIKKRFTNKQLACINKDSEGCLFTQESLSINMYDPAFSKQQKQYIEKQMQKNYFVTSIQKFKIKSNKINIFFMPHCERNLYQAVYQQFDRMTQKQKTHLIVIGNSVQEYKERCVLIKEKIPEIFLRLKLQEQKIIDYENALNDTFILI